jgi:hypothetical protein
MITRFCFFKSSQTNEQESCRDLARFVLIVRIVRVDFVAFANHLTVLANAMSGPAEQKIFSGSRE